MTTQNEVRLIAVTNMVGAALWAADLEKGVKTNPVETLKDPSARQQKDADEVELSGVSGRETRKEL
jgi:hypothetical protein